MTLNIRVVKVGGSLFDLPDLGERLAAWIEAQPPALTVLLAGGGEMADIIRRAQPLHELSEAAAHWLCIKAMGVTAHWLAAILGDATVVAQFEELRTATAHPLLTIRVFDPVPFLRQETRHLSGQPLPENWSVTSDSIAARLAVSLHAGELVLLKSRPAPAHKHLQQLADAGYVDPFFPQAADNLPQVEFVDLRSWTREDRTQKKQPGCLKQPGC